jgi:hypothetical protein
MQITAAGDPFECRLEIAGCPPAVPRRCVLSTHALTVKLFICVTISWPTKCPDVMCIGLSSRFAGGGSWRFRTTLDGAPRCRITSIAVGTGERQQMIC